MKRNTKGLTLRNPNYKNKNKNFSQNNPIYKSIVPVERTPTISLNSLRAKKRNNNQTYLVKKMQPAPKYAIEAFKHAAVRHTRRNNINRPRIQNKLHPTTFNRSVNKHNLLQEASIQRIPILNSNSIRTSTNNSINLSNRHSINSRSTTNTNSITNYTNPAIRYIRGITYRNKNPQKNISKFGTNNYNNNNNDNKSILSYNDEMWTNRNLNE